MWHILIVLIFASHKCPTILSVQSGQVLTNLLMKIVNPCLTIIVRLCLTKIVMFNKNC